MSSKSVSSTSEKIRFLLERSSVPEDADEYLKSLSLDQLERMAEVVEMVDKLTDEGTTARIYKFSQSIEILGESYRQGVIGQAFGVQLVPDRRDWHNYSTTIRILSRDSQPIGQATITSGGNIYQDPKVKTGERVESDAFLAVLDEACDGSVSKITYEEVVYDIESPLSSSSPLI